MNIFYTLNQFWRTVHSETQIFLNLILRTTKECMAEISTATTTDKKTNSYQLLLTHQSQFDKRYAVRSRREKKLIFIVLKLLTNEKDWSFHKKNRLRQLTCRSHLWKISRKLCKNFELFFRRFLTAWHFKDSSFKQFTGIWKVSYAWLNISKWRPMHGKSGTKHSENFCDCFAFHFVFH